MVSSSKSSSSSWCNKRFTCSPIVAATGRCAVESDNMNYVTCFSHEYMRFRIACAPRNVFVGYWCLGFSMCECVREGERERMSQLFLSYLAACFFCCSLCKKNKMWWLLLCTHFKIGPILFAAKTRTSTRSHKQSPTVTVWGQILYIHSEIFSDIIKRFPPPLQTRSLFLTNICSRSDLAGLDVNPHPNTAISHLYTLPL